jgi:DNA-binding transcriptional LysR family regulator
MTTLLRVRAAIRSSSRNRAATQLAMIRALERLREMFGDPLLVLGGRDHERTVCGERMLRELESLMPRLEAMVPRPV